MRPLETQPFISLVPAGCPPFPSQALPDEFGELHNLEQLWLCGNALTALPKLAGLTALRELSLENNALRKLPRDMGGLLSLRKFWCTENSLTALPSSFGNAGGGALNKVWLNSNKLESLPDSLCRLTSLQELALEDNKLVQLPHDFGQLTALRSLWLQDNQIEQLPPSFKHLTALHEVSLRGNHFDPSKRACPLPDNVKFAFRKKTAEEEMDINFD